MADFWAWLEQQRETAWNIGILECDFWRMTPAELAERAEMARREETRKDERAAWMVHYIMAAMVGSKNAPSPDRILGRTKDA